jgi:hypothetical protein
MGESPYDDLEATTTMQPETAAVDVPIPLHTREAT